MGARKKKRPGNSGAPRRSGAEPSDAGAGGTEGEPGRPAAEQVQVYAQAVFDAVPIPLLFLDEELRIESANRAFSDTFRIPWGNAEKKLISELGDGELNDPHILNILRRVVPEGTAVEGLQLEHRFPGIGWKALSISASRVGGPGTARPRLVVAIEDITECMLTEEALADERFRIETCFDHLPLLAYNIGFDGKILDCNEAVVKTLGYDSKQDLVGKPLISTVYAPSSRKKAEELLGKWKKEGRLRNEELQVITKQGKVLVVLLNVSTISDRSGRPLHSFSTHLDITARKQAEDALRASETVLKQAQSLAHVGSWIWNLKDNSFSMSEELCRVYGVKESERYDDIQDVIDRCVHPDDREYVENARREIRDGREGRALTYRIIRLGGEERWVTSTKPGVGVLGEDGKPEVLVGAVWDITELREAEEITRRDKATLEKLVKERSEELVDACRKLADAKRLSELGMLAATVAHELRNPLGVIQTAIYNVRRKRKEPSLDKHLSNIEKKMLESNQIIDNLLRYSSIRAPQYEEVQVCDILDETIASARKRFPEQQVSVLRDFTAVKGEVVEADALQIKEVLDNAFNNAYQALLDREGQIRVTAKLGPAETVVIAIKDNGTGIDGGDLDRVFEPFFSKRSKGTGLGLTICRELVSLHGGTITIESEKGAGTTVTVSLPCRRPEP